MNLGLQLLINKHVSYPLEVVLVYFGAALM